MPDLSAAAAATALRCWATTASNFCRRCSSSFRRSPAVFAGLAIKELRVERVVAVRSAIGSASLNLTIKASSTSATPPKLHWRPMDTLAPSASSEKELLAKLCPLTARSTSIAESGRAMSCAEHGRSTSRAEAETGSGDTCIIMKETARGRTSGARAETGCGGASGAEGGLGPWRDWGRGGDRCVAGPRASASFGPRGVDLLRSRICVAPFSSFLTQWSRCCVFARKCSTTFRCW
mmetsp:Transcript_59406/g.152975  ORF Transcript_59406/g.152975 Transcript_59406/m.152975 type:complete len:235 (+) Transcript_59406:1231-1935(+)